MLTQTLKNKVAALWDKFWSGGISNPLNAIEQITYLLFMKQLDELDKRKENEAAIRGEKYDSIFIGHFQISASNVDEPSIKVDKKTMRWSYFSKVPENELLNHIQQKVFPFIKQLNGSNSFFTKHMANAMFLIPSDRMLKESIKTINEIYEELEKENRFIDAQGDFYEYLLDSLRQAGKNGQFRTPPHIIELIVELVQPKLGDKIADPASGTSGFLLAAYKYILTQQTSNQYKQEDDNGFERGTLADKLTSEKDRKQLNEETFFGFDIDPTMIRIGLMNLMMHGITHPNIDYNDTLSKNYNEDDIYDVVMANPPFTGSIDKEELNPSFPVKTNKSELLFIERIYKMLQKGGTAGVIVPQGVLFGSGKAFVDIRKILIEDCELKAVITMPSGVFKPYAGVATAILIFSKGARTKNVWFFSMENDGFSMDDKRSPLFKSDGNRDHGDLSLIIKEFNNRNLKKENDRSKQCFSVLRDEIAENNYDLNLNTYKEEVFQDIIYENPLAILNKLTLSEREITQNIEELKELLS